MAKIIFLQQMWFPFGGTMALSAALKNARHKTRVAVGDQKKLLKEIKEFNPDIIAIPLITAYRKFMMEMCRNIKKEDIKALIIIGGYDPSFFPELIYNPEIDILCKGEGEDALVELANAVDKKEDYSHIKNLWIKKGTEIIKNEIRPFKNVNEKVFDDRDIYRDYNSYFRDLEFEQVMVGRGCPYSCSYCFNHKYREMYAPISKNYCDLRDVENVIEECLILQNKYKIKFISFNDSTLAYNKKWFLEFLEKYKEKVDIPFSINACMNEIDEEFCKALANTKRCYLLKIGLEAGNEKIRFEVLNKKITTEQMIKATGLLKRYKLRYTLLAMLGLPGESLENAFETLDLAIKLADKNTILCINIFKPFPKLNITEYGVKIGQYNPEFINNTNLIGDNVMNIFNNFREDEDGKKILTLSRFAQLYFHFPFLRGIIKNKLIYTKDNLGFRTLMKYCDHYYVSRHHANASWVYLFKYVFKHRNKKVWY